MRVYVFSVQRLQCKYVCNDATAATEATDALTGVNHRTNYTGSVREQTPLFWSRVFRLISCSSSAAAAVAVTRGVVVG